MILESSQAWNEEGKNLICLYKVEEDNQKETRKMNLRAMKLISTRKPFEWIVLKRKRDVVHKMRRGPLVFCCAFMPILHTHIYEKCQINLIDEI
jgi:hypothetical protein